MIIFHTKEGRHYLSIVITFDLELFAFNFSIQTCNLYKYPYVDIEQSH